MRPGLALLVVFLLAAGCGDDPASLPRPEDRPVRVALLEEPLAPGEILLRGDASPKSHGPLELRGAYVVRFQQWAPEDPLLDFGGQTSFVAMLNRKPEQEGADSKPLFARAAAAGRTRVRARGRWYLDVSFGDFPYAIRLTPR